jgi:ABC-type transport system involved in multi-copper enzyme maturation permease subunit
MRSLTIARATFREAFHLPVLHVIMIGSVVLLLIVAMLPGFSMSIYDDMKMLKDLAIATATLCGVLVTIFAAVNVITLEIENWTVVTVLSKPVRRWEFIVGKFLGLVFTLSAAFAILTVLYILVVWWGMWESISSFEGIYPELKANFWAVAFGAADELWRGMVMCLLQVIVLGAVAVACCVRAPMILSAVIFFSLFVAAAERAGAGAASGAGAAGAFLVKLLVVDIGSLSFSLEAAPGRLITGAMMGWGALYAVVYSAAVLLVAVLLFRNREVI